MQTRRKADTEPSHGRDDRIRVAYHEAGHAVMAWLMEQRTLVATILPDDETSGQVSIVVSNCETVLDYYRDQIMIFIAGDAVELTFLDPPTEGFTKADLWNVLRRIELMEILTRGDCPQKVYDCLDSEDPPDFPNGLLERLLEKHRGEFEPFLEEAMDILNEESKAVEAVAQALLSNGSLSGEEIGAVIDEIIWSQ